MMPRDGDSRHFDAILRQVKLRRGLDLSSYHRAPVLRRMSTRMDAVHVSSLEAYLGYMRAHPRECDTLFDAVLNHTTSFFRDPGVWDYLRTTGVAAMLEQQRSTGPFRVWAAGCASGQEAYSILMLVAEVIGAEQTRAGVVVYASDVHPATLTHGGSGLYTDDEVESVPAPLLRKYFDHQVCGDYLFDPELRECITFGTHDLLANDAVSDSVDFVLCRNTLMYFNQDAESRILTHFFLSLGSGGHLLLGQSDMLSSYADIFRPVDLSRRLFRAV